MSNFCCNFEGTDIDYSMCSTILPSGDSSGTTLEVPSEALLHRSKVQSHVCAHTQALSQQNINKFIFSCLITCVCQTFVVPLQRICVCARKARAWA